MDMGTALLQLKQSIMPGKRLVNFIDPNGHDIEVCESLFKG
jgi:hypothetical protein